MKNTVTVNTLVDAPVMQVWKYWTTSSDIMGWNNASEDWHTPRAENDLRTGGRFNYRMESRDGKTGFDFNGVYGKVIPYSMIEYTLADGRNVSISFTSGTDGITISETFETESTLSPEKQREGWQAILDNFRKYTESRKSDIPQHQITPCLWFDDQAEEAVSFYTSIFGDSETGRIVRYGKAGYDVHKRPAGSVQTIEFRIRGQWFTALNGGPVFKFSEAISMQVICETQQEIDYYWEKLSEGGQKGPCGWLTDKFGLSWQVAPAILPELLAGDPERAERVTEVYLKMKKFDIDELLKA